MMVMFDPMATAPLPPHAVAATFRAIDEPHPGTKLRDAYARRADAYAAWYLRDGDAARPSAAEGIEALEFHMPELVPVYRDLCAQVADEDQIAARMFTFLRPPASIIACSQGVWREGEEGPLLVRNYDYPAELMDGVILRTAFLGRTVIGTADGVWGLCDGMNDRGLAVSLTFGGRVVVGDGFGMPLVVRYLLETCSSVAETKEVLARLPYSQAYNLTMTDADSDVVTAYLGPDRAPSYRRMPVATNHQWVVESWDPLLAASSVEREWWLLRLLDDPDVDMAIFSNWFLAPPLFSYAHTEGAGTVFTASYAPSTGEMTHRWHGQDWVQWLDTFTEGEREIIYPSPVAV
ncbi:MAG: C45 family peptidase [Actinomycetota bacterium]